MKFKYIKSIVSAALFLSLTTGITSCINDLDISPIDPQMTATFDQDMYFTNYTLHWTYRTKIERRSGYRSKGRRSILFLSRSFH